MDKRAGDTLVRIGVWVFGLGLAAIVVIFAPFVWDLATQGADEAQSPRNEKGVALNLATFLVSVGLAVALWGLLRQARESRQRARDHSAR